MDAYPITSEASGVAGTIGCFVVRNSSGTICGDGTITAISGGGDLEFDDLAVTNGDTIAMSSLRINLG